MLDFTFSNRFKKDLDLMEKRRKNMDKLYDIMTLIIFEEPLPKHCREHILHGNLEGFWECHIEGDWIIIYDIDPINEMIYFSRTGTHSDLL
ncbi:MAG: type II toxin-antitoxin system YafQ family toxin [Spirochaetaceae bacterium]|nr:type II toxin-antitoxin system YafQ family toxin [Spirochaetaceae bacterium]